MPDTSEIPNNTKDTTLLNKRIAEERFFMDSLEFGLTYEGYHLQVRSVNPNPVIGKYKYYMFPRHDFHGWLYGVDLISPFMPDSKYKTGLRERIDNLNDWITAQYGAADVRMEMPDMSMLKTDTVIFFNRWYAGEKRIETGVGKVGGEMYYAVCKLRHRRRWIDFLLSRNVSTVNINLKKLQRNYIPPFDYYYTRSK